jgi:hypothetical protein
MSCFGCHLGFQIETQEKKKSSIQVVNIEKCRLEVDFNRIGVGVKSKWSEGKA